MKKIVKFLLELILGLVARGLMIILEIINIIVVFIKYGFEGLNYFQKTGRTLDVISAGRHRTLRNILVVGKNGIKATKGTEKTISYYTGINYLNNTTTYFGICLYYFLYAVDFSCWNKGGHCADSVRYFNSLKTKKIGNSLNE